MASSSPPPKKRRVLDPIIDILRWAWDRLERTIALAIKLVFPSKFISPLGFLGMLTFVVFLVLGVTGALLMLHYTPSFGDCTPGSPTCNLAFQSVASINNQVNFGEVMRNIHYHASNAMVLLAVMHMFYQFFSGRYKLRYEMLWITGVILGVITVVEAYTGYDLILNIRGQLAVNIGRTLTLLSPPRQILGSFLAQLIFGFGFNDIVLRFYAFHVFLIPIVMLALMGVHLPKNLVLDIPVSSAVIGIIFIMGGLFPVELGVQYNPNFRTEITFPEWYFTSLYAFIRVGGLDPFIAGAIIPAVFVIIFLVVPLIDRGKRIAMIDRPFWMALGVAALGQIAIVTVWGFRAANPLLPLSNADQLIIDPALFTASILVASALAYGFVYAYVRWRRAKNDALRAARKPLPYRRTPPYLFTRSEVYALVGGLLVLQAFLDFAIFKAVLIGLPNYILFEIGLVFIAFGAMFHIYRVSVASKLI